MIVAGVDIESAGLSQPDGARIIEIALIKYDLATKREISRFIQRINPEIPIEPEAQRVHKIAISDLYGEPRWEEVAPKLVAALDDVDLLVAHNMGFDGPFIAGELVRIGLPVPNVDSFCTKENGRWATFDGKHPKLKELCFALGVEYDESKAHAASYDVERCVECFFKGYERGFFELPESFTTMGKHANCYADATIAPAA